MTESTLNNIPHLPLNIEFDHEKILEEIKSLPQAKKYRSALSNGKIMKIHEKETWDSIALYSIDGKMESNPAEPWTGEFIKTEALELCPYLDSVLQSVGCGKLLARIEFFAKDGSAGWHSHIMEAGQPEWISVWNLPLVMPRESKFSVLSFMEYRGSDYTKPVKVYEERYECGKMYCLNSYHYHNAFNYSDDPMVMVRFYADSRDPKVKEILQKAMDMYTGEYIQSYEDYVSTIGVT